MKQAALATILFLAGVPSLAGGVCNNMVINGKWMELAIERHQAGATYEIKQDGCLLEVRELGGDNQGAIWKIDLKNQTKNSIPSIVSDYNARLAGQASGENLRSLKYVTEITKNSGYLVEGTVTATMSVVPDGKLHNQIDLALNGKFEIYNQFAKPGQPLEAGYIMLKPTSAKIVDIHGLSIFRKATFIAGANFVLDFLSSSVTEAAPSSFVYLGKQQ